MVLSDLAAQAHHGQSFKRHLGDTVRQSAIKHRYTNHILMFDFNSSAPFYTQIQLQCLLAQFHFVQRSNFSAFNISCYNVGLIITAMFWPSNGHQSVNVSVLIMFSQKTSLFTLIIINSP